MVQKRRDRTLDLLEEQIEKLERQHAQFIEALKELFEFKLPGHIDKASPFYCEGDEEAPFFSEAYLYNLLEKEDARTVLAHLHSIERPFGYRDGEKLPERKASE